MITLINGNVQNLAGLAIPNGSIVFQLNVDATIIAAPYGIVLAEEVVVFQFDSTGNIQSGAQIYSNKELEPQNANGLGTYYLVTFYDANGARINKNPMWWQFPQAMGATVDISTMTPYATGGGNIIFYPIPAGGGGTVTSVWNVVTKIADYTARAGDMILANSTAGGFTITLPLSSANADMSIRVKKISLDINSITVSGSGSDFIDYSATQVIKRKGTDLETTADGSATWWIV